MNIVNIWALYYLHPGFLQHMSLVSFHIQSITLISFEVKTSPVHCIL